MSQMDSLLKERNQLGEINSQLDDFINSAQNSHNSLVRQHGILRSTKNKMVDVAQRIGVSKSLIKKIESRQMEDARLVYGCMCFTLFLFFFLGFGMRRLWAFLMGSPEEAIGP